MEVIGYSEHILNFIFTFLVLNLWHVWRMIYRVVVEFARGSADVPRFSKSGAGSGKFAGVRNERWYCGASPQLCLLYPQIPPPPLSHLCFLYIMTVTSLSNDSLISSHNYFCIISFSNLKYLRRNIYYIFFITVNTWDIQFTNGLDNFLHKNNSVALV